MPYFIHGTLEGLKIFFTTKRLAQTGGRRLSIRVQFSQQMKIFFHAMAIKKMCDFDFLELLWKMERHLLEQSESKFYTYYLSENGT